MIAATVFAYLFGAFFLYITWHVSPSWRELIFQPLGFAYCIVGGIMTPMPIVVALGVIIALIMLTPLELWQLERRGTATLEWLKTPGPLT